MDSDGACKTIMSLKYRRDVRIESASFQFKERNGKQRIKDRRDKQEEERQDEREKASANDYIFGEEGSEKKI